MCEHGSITTIEINHKHKDIDACIAPIVLALNNAGIRTKASCCGHFRMPGSIILEDGSWIMVMSETMGRGLMNLYPETIFGELKGE
jgi:hypothetical protein